MKLLMKKLNHRKSKISEKVEVINYSAVRKAFSAGRKEGVINLTIGQPDFDVPKTIKDCAKKYIDDGFNRYTETRGVLGLRRAVSEYLKEKGIKRNEDEIIITPGTTAGIYMSLMALINPSDEIVIFEPYFVAYKEIINLLGGKVVIVKTDDNFQPLISDLSKKITNKTKAIIINSPNNPTGSVYSKEIIKEVANIARKANVYVISDEVYTEFSYGTKVSSPAEYYKETIVLDGLSKSKGMTGWRIGFIAGPKNIIDAIEKIQQFSFVCAPAPFQYASVDYLKEKIDSAVINRYQEIRDGLYNELKNDYQIVEPRGAFYMFIKTPVLGEQFAIQLLKKNIAVVPGSAFGDNYKNYIRISFAIKKELVPEIIKVFKSMKKGT
jgi:aspartate/methionine/tyrosine aminotransferase